MLHGLELEKAHKTILTNNLMENTKMKQFDIEIDETSPKVN